MIQLQQIITKLEQDISDLIKEHKEASGYLKSLMNASIVDRYMELRSYHRNMPHAHIPTYQRITDYVVDNDMIPKWLEKGKVIDKTKPQ